jgi:DNA polymerase alpha subunit A
VVSEDQYKRIVGERLEESDFVVDDGVGGYMDNGMDDWTGGNDEAEESEEEIETRRKCVMKYFCCTLVLS